MKDNRQNHNSSFIDGVWIDSSSSEPFAVRDPGDTRKVVATYLTAGEEETLNAVAAVKRAFGAWATTPASDRAQYVYALIDLWRDRIEEVARTATSEMGKPLRESRSEATRAIVEMRYWAAEALHLGDRTFESTRPNTVAYTIRQPIGPVAAITPWNFPILTPLRKVIPALVCGCTVILKPAVQAPGPSVLIAEMLEKVQLPKGVFNLIVGSGRSVGGILTANPDIAGISFTGSTQVGLAIERVAADRNAKVQLEMGGKNAAVVADYSNIDHAAKEIVNAAFTTSGQRCTSVSRVIVLKEQQKELEAALKRYAEERKVGHGLDEESEMGPVSNDEQMEKVEHYISLARNGEGHIITGGHRSSEEGYYFEPTIVTDVRPDSPLATEEIFGPVLTVVPVKDFEEAVSANNGTVYGLTSAIFTDRMEFAHQFTMRSEAGMVHVNHGTSSEGHLPFGGWKQSGQGAFGIGDTSKEFFTNLKAVYRMNPAG